MASSVPVLSHYEWQKAVLDKDLSTPPDSPNRGDRYIVGYNPSGDWYNKPKQIAQWNGTEWEFITYFEGMVVYVNDESIQYQYCGSKWRPFPNRIKRLVEIIDEDTEITVNDAGKIICCDSTSAVTCTLPTVSDDDVGVELTFARVGPGDLILKAAGEDVIEDSGPGDTIENDASRDSANASIVLMLIKEDRWIIMSGNGTWQTTDSSE